MANKVACVEEDPARHDENEVMSVIQDTSSLRGNSDVSVAVSTQMNIGFYKVDLTRRNGQIVFSLMAIILPLIPFFMLLFFNYTEFTAKQREFNALVDVQDQLMNAIDFARLTRQLQSERTSVALKLFDKNVGQDKSGYDSKFSALEGTYGSVHN